MQRRETRGWFGVVQRAQVCALAVGDKEKHKQETNFPVITYSTWQAGLESRLQGWCSKYTLYWYQCYTAGVPEAQSSFFLREVFYMSWECVLCEHSSCATQGKDDNLILPWSLFLFLYEISTHCLLFYFLNFHAFL